MGQRGMPCALQLLLLAALSVTLGAMNISKCCPLHKQLSFDLHTCIDYEGGATDASWWLQAELSPAAGWRVSPGRRQSCSGALATLLLQDGEDLSLDASGHLVLDVGGQALELPPPHYCLDRLEVGGGHAVALVCVCSALSCWTSCCPQGMALHLTGPDRMASCRPSDGEAEDDWEPAQDVWRGDASGPPRWRVASLPECGEDEHLVQLAAGRHFQLLGDGRAALDGSGPLLAHQYCAAPGHFLYCKRRAGGHGALAILYVCLLAVGAGFLAATVLAYCCLPGLLCRSLSRALVLHCCCLLCAYVATAVLHGARHIPQPACAITAYVIQFSYLAAFSWLNVMCFDLALTLRRPRDSSARAEGRKLLVYCAYAWATPAVFSVATAAVDLSPGVPSTSALKPNIGHRSCWFKGDRAMLLYFYGPISFNMLVNLSLFLFVAAKVICRQEYTAIRQEFVNYRNGSSDAVKPKRKHIERLIMFTKMFILMGLTWITDVLSWIFGSEAANFWILTDIINISRAAFIFYIFCCKKVVLRALLASLPKFCQCSDKQSGCSTDSGSSGNIYRLQSNDDSCSPIMDRNTAHNLPNDNNSNTNT